MVSAFFGLNTGLQSLIASQLALDTAAHNTANATTEGYSRQRVTLVTGDPYSYPAFNRSGMPGQIGTGVSVSMIGRARDAFIDLQLRQETSQSGAWATRSDQLGRLQDVFPEPGTTALGASLARFWGAWQDVAADPTSSAARNAVLQQSAGLSADFNRAAGQIQAIISAQDDSVRQGIDDLNAIATQIASLNGEIKRVAAVGDQPNDLMDQRDLLFDRLAKLVPVTLEPQRDATVKVMIGGTDLVTGEMARPVTGVVGPTGLVPTWSSGTTLRLGNAQLGQFVQLRDTDLPAYLAKLDTLAAGVATAVNTIHATGRDQDGNPGVAVFVPSTGVTITAATISLNPALAGHPRLIAAAAAINTPGDGTIAGRIADLQTGAIISSESPSEFYASLVGEVGADAAHATTMQANQDLVVEHLKARRESISGVSLDEEATDMVRYQHQYQAAARVITIMDQNLDTIISSMGTVGR
jgi:flagellar hook-associated protein 1